MKSSLASSGREGGRKSFQRTAGPAGFGGWLLSRVDTLSRSLELYSELVTKREDGVTDAFQISSSCYPELRWLQRMSICQCYGASSRCSRRNWRSGYRRDYDPLCISRAIGSLRSGHYLKSVLIAPTGYCNDAFTTNSLHGQTTLILFTTSNPVASFPPTPHILNSDSLDHLRTMSISPTALSSVCTPSPGV
ncbi:hypothetical protein RSAG8_08765, partial [Rhizoctonia solani AG-8 WAC10335]